MKCAHFLRYFFARRKELYGHPCLERKDILEIAFTNIPLQTKTLVTKVFCIYIFLRVTGVSLQVTNEVVGSSAYRMSDPQGEG